MEEESWFSLSGLLFIVVAILIVLILVEVVKLVLSASTTPTKLPPPPAPKKKLEFKNYTKDELANYNGKDTSLPLLISIKGKVYDLSSNRGMYGPGGPYAVFTGREAAVLLAKGSLDVKDAETSIENLTPGEIETLNDWISFFEAKYDIVGKLL